MIKKLTELDYLTFGKYKGRLILDIIEEDPSYALWLHRGTDKINFNPSTIHRLIELELDNDWDWGDYADIF